MLGRILIIMVLVGLGLWLLKKTMGSRKPPPTNPNPEQAKLIVCAHCGAAYQRQTPCGKKAKVIAA